MKTLATIRLTRRTLRNLGDGTMTTNVIVNGATTPAAIIQPAYVDPSQANGKNIATLAYQDTVDAAQAAADAANATTIAVAQAASNNATALANDAQAMIPVAQSADLDMQTQAQQELMASEGRAAGSDYNTATPDSTNISYGGGA